MISLLVFAIYMIVYFIKFGIPQHISETYTKWGMLFTIMIWAMAFEFGKVAFERYEDIGWLSYMLVSAMMFVGASPMLDEDMEGAVHRISAMVAMAVSCLWVSVVNPLGFIAYVFLLMIPTGNWLLWVELACLYGVCVSMCN